MDVHVKELEEDGGEVGPQDFGLGILGTGEEVLLGVEAEADASLDTAAATGALAGAALGNGLNGEAPGAGVRAVAADPGETGIDDVADAGDGDRGFRDIGGDYDTPTVRGFENFLLVVGGEAAEKGEDIGMGQGERIELVLGFADGALARHKDENIAEGEIVDNLAGNADGGLDGIFVEGIFAVRVVNRPVENLDGVEATGDLDNGCALECLGEAGGIDGGGGNDNPEIGSLVAEPSEETEDEIDIQAALVGFIDDEDIVIEEEGVPLEFIKKDPVGHELDERPRRGAVLEADGRADIFPPLDPEFLGNAARNGEGGDPAGLGAPDFPPAAEAGLEAKFWDLGCLSGSGLPGEDENGVVL